MNVILRFLVHGALLFLTGAAGIAHAVEIRLSCTGVGQEAEFCKSSATAWADKTGNTVQIVTPPNDASQRLGLYQQLLSAQSDKIDVLQIDVVWPGLLGRHLLDLRPYTQGVERQHIAGFVATSMRVPERTVSALFEAVFGYRVWRATYMAALEAADEAISEQTATRDFKTLVDAGLLEPHGDKRGRYYTAAPPLQDIARRARQSRRPKDFSDPFAGADPSHP